MATRYLAIAARPGQFTEERLGYIARRIGLQPIEAADGLALFVSVASDYVPLPDKGGIIIGPLFSRDATPRRVHSLTSGEAIAIRRDNGLRLITDYWGGYVALVKSTDSRAIFALRDPTGAMPCYHVDVEGGSVFGSDIDMLVDSGLLDPMIDWDFLPTHLYYADLRTPRTAILGAKELLAGTRYSTSNWGERVTQTWSPWDHVESPGLSDKDAAGAVAEMATKCVGAWASCYERIVVGVSGGLDSSIVAACLKDQPTPWHCLTLATREPDGDERVFARLLSDALGQPLSEAFHRLEDIDISRSTTAHLPRPIGFLFGQSQEKTRLNTLTSKGADAFFTGQGGDNVFCFLRSSTPLLDRLRTKGPTPGAAETLFDLAKLTGSSVSTIALTAMKRARRPSVAYNWRGDGRFLRLKSEPPAYPHPWLQAPRGALAGKAVQISLLLRIQGTLDGFPRDTPPLVTPLLSQPLIELCLSLPTWQWCAGGIDRAIARRGFRGRLPDALVDRRSKGGPNSFSVHVIEAFRKEFRERLLDGVLAAHDLIDRPSIEASLADDAIVRSPDHLRLLALAEAEAWARHWIDRREQIRTMPDHFRAPMAPAGAEDG